MKMRFLNIVLGVLVAGFMAGCSDEDIADALYDDDDYYYDSDYAYNDYDDAVVDAYQDAYGYGYFSGGYYYYTDNYGYSQKVYAGYYRSIVSENIKTSNRGVVSEEMATSKQETTKTTLLSRDGDKLGVSIVAKNAFSTILFNIDFPAGATSGQIESSYIGYIEAGTTIYNRAAPFTVNITKAVDNGSEVHIKGTIDTTVADSNDNAKDISLSFDVTTR